MLHTVGAKVEVPTGCDGNTICFLYFARNLTLTFKDIKQFFILRQTRDKDEKTLLLKGENC